MFHNYLVFFFVAYGFMAMVFSQSCQHLDGMMPCAVAEDCPDDAFQNPPRLPFCNADLICCMYDDPNAIVVDTTTTTTVAPSPSATSTKKPATCIDQVNPKTGVSDCPMRRDLCDDPVYDEVMTRQCPLTCNRCNRTAIGNSSTSCLDQLNPRTGVSDCPMRKNLCTDPNYRELMKKECPKTCGICNATNNNTGTNGNTGTTGTCNDRINQATGISDCPARRAYCTKPEYRELMEVECPVTCGFC